MSDLKRLADAPSVSRCSCGGQDGRYHSDQCIVEAAKSQGWSDDPEAKECQARVDEA